MAKEGEPPPLSSMTIRPSFMTLSWRDRSPLLVTKDSPPGRRRVVEKFARYFKGEYPSSGAGFRSSDGEGSPYFSEYEAHLFFEDLPGNGKLGKTRKCVVTGCCCFRRSRAPEYACRWMLEWAWFHPFARRENAFLSRWEAFEERYGRFHVMDPYPAELAGKMRERSLEESAAAVPARKRY